ncbi:hypothetical protein [Phaeobacter sp. C3_T13_0]|uniref:hypothetical protein n=1 Tax=Phaeobacter cretensis TaxID=3342641 RepID=UPI0039BCE186
MNKVSNEILTQGPPAPVPPTQASIGAEALAALAHRRAEATASTKMESPTDSTDNGQESQPNRDAPDQNTDQNIGQDISPDMNQTRSGIRPDHSLADLDRLAAHLRGGSQPLAARADLIELHKRITAMFATLNDGLGEMYTQKAEGDRIALSARIDTLEEAVNRMEGALRIELEPVLRDSFAKVIADTSIHQRGLGQRLKRGLVRSGFCALILALGLAAGTLYHSRIATASSTAWTEAQTQWASFVRFIETTSGDTGP